MVLKKFNYYLNEGIIKKHRTDMLRAKSLIEEAGKRKLFLNEMTNKIGISEENANYFVEHSYDVIMELIRAKLLIDGFKSIGLYAHEAEVAYLRDINFSETDVIFIDELRYFRNGIIYYGKKLNKKYAEIVVDFLENKYPELKKLFKDLE